MTIHNDLYDSRFFQDQYWGSLRSARSVVPRFVELYGLPENVVDVGGGLMPWLEAFGEAGCSSLLGLDCVAENFLPPSKFPRDYQLMDLNKSLAIPGKFDVAVCLEVAEHLPLSSADTLVTSLAATSDCILFSAAIPGQGGTGHVNEQWQSWWAAKFASKGFSVDTSLREAIWDDAAVEWWYRQNILVFRTRSENVRPSSRGLSGTGSLDVVHPELYGQLVASIREREYAEEWPAEESEPRRRFLKGLIRSLMRFSPTRRLARFARRFSLARSIWRFLD